MSTVCEIPRLRFVETLRVAQWQLMPTLVRLTLFLAVLGNGIDIARATDRSEGVTISFQVLLRIFTTGLATLCGAWGWWRLPEVRTALRTRRGWVAVALIFMAFAAGVTSPSPKVALFVAHALGAYLLLTLTSLTLFGIRRTLFDALLGLWSFVIISWLIRILKPDLAVFNEFLSMEETLQRFGGLGHPNVLSAIQCMGMLLLLSFVREKMINRIWLVPAVGLLLITLIETKSRTPVVAFAATLGVMTLPLLKFRAAYLLPVAIAALAFVGAGLVEMTMGIDRAVDVVALKLTKTGSVEELTSATGRTEIWSTAISLIKQSPITGYGGGTSSQVMEEHSGHAHNLLLETALLFGIPAALLFICLLFVNIHDSVGQRTFFVREFTCYLLVLGLVESPLFGLVPDPSMCIWMACSFGAVVVTRQGRSMGPMVCGEAQST